MNENLNKAAGLGQGIWIDSISRDDLVEGGALHQMIEDGVVGVTSNPSIFQKAISESELYDEQLEEASRETDDPKKLFWKLAVRDVQYACDILAPVYERTATKDGYVSLAGYPRKTDQPGETETPSGPRKTPGQPWRRTPMANAHGGEAKGGTTKAPRGL